MGYVFNEEHELSLRIDMSAGENYPPIDVAASKENNQLMYHDDHDWNDSRRSWRKKVHLRYSSNSFFEGWTLRSYFEIKNLLNDTHLMYKENRPTSMRSSPVFYSALLINL